MKRQISALLILAALSACGDGEPIFDDPTETETETETDTDTDAGIDSDGGLPPGTESPTTDSAIVRYEGRDGETGGGFVKNVSYNSADDTLTVSSLAFDGTEPYNRDEANAVRAINGYAVYEADVVVDDFLTDSDIGQLVPTRAIYGVSDNTVDGSPRTSFVIVRTGAYASYGFGGFVYQREGGVVLPSDSSAQATFDGDYAGVRVFNGTGGVEYTEGDMTMSIDFGGFGDNIVVNGIVTNRTAYDANGGSISIDRDPSNGIIDGSLVLPNLRWYIDGDLTAMDENGEITGEVLSGYVDENGTYIDYESGTYYAIVAGDLTDPADGGEIVGVMTIESSDTRYEGITAQETGGFILYRSDD